jgi:hypothetical protein
MYVLINTAKIKYLPYKSKRVFQKHKKTQNTHLTKHHCPTGENRISFPAGQ